RRGERPTIRRFIYGSAATDSSNATVGMPGNLFSHGLCRSPVQCAGKRSCLACSPPNTKALGQMEHILRLADAGPHPFSYLASRSRTKRRSLSEMGETLVR